MSLKPPILTVGKFQFYSVSQTGISFAPETPRAEWLDVVKRLTHFYEGSVMAKERCLMLLADALNFGSNAFGEEHAQAIEGLRQSLGLTPKTIANAQWVYGKIPAEKRRDGITLGHMSVIAALPEEAQETLMDEVLKDHLTVTDLKSEVASRFPKTKRGQDRKKKATEAVETTESVIVRNLNQCADWFSEHEPIKEMKDALEALYKTYRRKWASGRKQK